MWMWLGWHWPPTMDTLFINYKVMWKLTGLQFQSSPSFPSCVTMGRLPTLSELGAFTCKVQMPLLCKAVTRAEDFLWSADTVVSCPEAL